MARPIPSRRSRGTFSSHPGTERNGHERGALGLRRGGGRGGRGGRPVHPHQLCGTEATARRSAGRDRPDAGAQRRELERGRSGRVHERLRARLAHELRHGRPRAVRLAAAVRSLPGRVLRPGEDARFADLRGSARAAVDARPRPVHCALRAALGRRGRRERAVHVAPPEAGRPLADPARSHVERPEVKRVRGRLPTARPPILLTAAVVLMSAACNPSGDGVVALEGATLLDGSGREPVKDALILVKNYTKSTPALLKPLMDEASTLRLAVAAHLGKTDAITAARAGVASLEHMAGVVQAAVRDPAPYFKAHDQFLSGWTLEEAGWAALDSGSVQRVARAVAATRTAVVPPLVLHGVP